ncbi:polyketide cyclase/dehydrase/lipid transport protein [Tamaricihabitans halophyticus]|uniref:Polyketide cyclase/dehydrase/lipid transport protein n=1 Tax=Tamaricihabitans halophyticus TaxID=1262583 RepID=A0A4R2R3V7_9PSEU|nr:SRPBCC family protein [Tamaricihabitans halophyticus]TCP57532.1 polyketide cyclase/dehydrase/lipid transport protein [Tamaricihabitans halophyticus]
MTESRSVHVERLIAAPAEQIFAVLADPRRHAELDGSGMVQGAARVPEHLGLGAEFEMNMRQRRDYRSVSTVVEYEQDRLLTWETVGRWRGRKVIGGQWWRYRLTPQGQRTLVRHSYLWGRASLPLLTIWLPGFPRRMAPAMRDSLKRLATITERGQD